MKKKKVEKWAEFGKSSGWHKIDSQTKRRRAVLKSKRTALTAYHSLDQLAKVSTDSETRRKARMDATYFLRLHNKKKKKV